MSKLLIFSLGVVLGGPMIRLTTHAVYLTVIGGLVTYILVNR